MPSSSRSRRWLAATAAAALAGGLVAVLTTTGPADAAATNLVANPGFESGLTGWTCSAGTVVTSPVHTGTRALSGAATASDDAQCAQTVSVQPNSAYSLSAWVEGNFVFLGATGTGTTDPSTFTQSAPTYTQLTTTFTTGAATTSVTVFVHGWFGQGTYEADDVSLTGPAGTTPPPPTTTAPPPTSTTVAQPPPTGGFTHPVYFMPLDNNPQPISSIITDSGETEFNLAFV
ncbi:MAG TPA: carbohydrate binding domain-containing protein, partial [Pseudonocardiaceae bacterium]|nr:carbohydrate binding domain-containing protein [Pseudonocardiaceae bacterium]